jgi:prepilin-type processing-associated H-X9-DG protein
MAFRLRTIFYVFALVGSALATFGGGGIGVAAFVLGFWWMVLYGPRWKLTLVELLVYLLIIAVLILLFLPAVQSARESSRVMSCRNNMKQLALGLINCDQTRSSLPPAYLADAKGNPILSWRVELLPYIEYLSLYEQIDRTLPWDAAANRAAVSNVQIYDLQCPGDATAAIVSYFAVIDPRTVWPGGKRYRLADVADGLSRTILLIEAHRDAASWAEPRDLSFDEAVDLLSRPVPDGEGHAITNGFFYKPGRGRNVAFADGSIAFLQTPLSRELAAALLTANGHEKIDDNEIERVAAPQLDYAKCYVFGLFAFLALLPAAWVKWRLAATPGGA